MSLTFRNSIPRVVQDNPAADSFISVLDELRKHKQSLMHKAHRVYNPVLLTNKEFLTKKVSELGYPPVPYGFPKYILDNMYLYAEDVMSLMGSKIGLKLLLWVLTGGDVEVDDSNFYPKEDYIVLGDTELGVLPEGPEYPDDFLYLFSGVDDLTGASIKINIYTPFYENEDLKNYILDNITRFVGFSDDHTIFEITFGLGNFVTNGTVYPYFINVPEEILYYLVDKKGNRITDVTDRKTLIRKLNQTWH